MWNSSVFKAGTLILVSQLGLAQTTGQQTAGQTSHRAKSSTKVAAATWSPDVQAALGIGATDFRTAGLNKLTQPQLEALESSAKSHPYVGPKDKLLSCAASSIAPGARIAVLITVAGDDPTGQRATEIQQAVRSLAGVDVVTGATAADRALHVVIQEQTLGKRTIGYTASYMTATPCVDQTGGKKADVELKGELGTYTEPKGSDLAHDLAGMLDHDLQGLRGTTSSK